MISSAVRFAKFVDDVCFNRKRESLVFSKGNAFVRPSAAEAAGSDAAGASLIKEGTGGGATLISGSVSSTGSFGVIETPQGATSNHTLRVSGSHIKGGSATTASFGTMEIQGFKKGAGQNLTDFSSSLAGRVQASEAGQITSITFGYGLTGGSVTNGTVTSNIDYSGAEDTTFKDAVSGSFRGELSSSLVKVVGGGVSGSAASTFNVGAGGVQIANHLKDNQKTHVGVVNSGKYYAISGSAVSTGSFGKVVSSFQSGYLYHYVLSVVVGLTLFLSIYIYIYKCKHSTLTDPAFCS